MKDTIQVAIVALGVGAFAYGVSKMAAETVTMIMPEWIIIVAVSLVGFLVSMGIGFFVKHLLDSNWHPVTFTAIVLLIIVGIYSIVDYKPTLKIFVLPDYAGEVKLVVSRDKVERHDISVNSFGIGYITRRDFENGFYPKIVKGQKDISKEIKEYSKGSTLSSQSDSYSSYSFEFLTFVVPGRSDHAVKETDDLLRNGAVDTMRLPRINVR